MCALKNDKCNNDNDGCNSQQIQETNKENGAPEISTFKNEINYKYKNNNNLNRNSVVLALGGGYTLLIPVIAICVCICFIGCLIDDAEVWKFINKYRVNKLLWKRNKWENIIFNKILYMILNY